MNLAWLAGLIEGDGSMAVVQTCPRYKCGSIRIAMLDKDIIQRVANIFKSNIGSYLTPKGDKTMYRTAAYKRNIVEPLIWGIYEFMGIRRKQQIHKIMDHYYFSDIRSMCHD